MDAVLNVQIKEALDLARRQAKGRRRDLTMQADGITLPVAWLSKDGFALAVEDAPLHGLRGFVDLFEGEKHLFQCLVVAHEPQSDVVMFEFKRATQVGAPPPADYVREVPLPAGLLSNHTG